MRRYSDPHAAGWARRSTCSRRRFLAVASASAWLGGRPASGDEPPRDDASWLRELQQPPAEFRAPARSLEIVDAAGRPIVDLDTWQRCRGPLRQWWLDFLGPLATQERRLPELQVIDEAAHRGVVRQRVRYEVLPSVRSEAYLLRPESARGKLPGVVVFHSTVKHSIRQPAGVEGRPEKAFGWKLDRRGCVAFCPRNFLWPDNRRMDTTGAVRDIAARHPESRGMARMLYDGQIALDLLAADPQVDARRLGTIGHSLGAKQALYLAAFDERVRAAVSSEGGVGIPFSNWEAPWYLGPEAKQADFAHDHHELLALVAPRALLLVGGDSADGRDSWPYVAAALPIHRLASDRPAKLGLFCHGQGHSVPPAAEQAAYEWFDRLL